MTLTCRLWIIIKTRFFMICQNLLYARYALRGVWNCKRNMTSLSALIFFQNSPGSLFPYLCVYEKSIFSCSVPFFSFESCFHFSKYFFWDSEDLFSILWISWIYTKHSWLESNANRSSCKWCQLIFFGCLWIGRTPRSTTLWIAFVYFALLVL